MKRKLVSKVLSVPAVPRVPPVLSVPEVSGGSGGDAVESPQRALIIDAAFEKFRRFGLRRVSVDEIARDLRISKKTFYQHFPTKEALVRACLFAKVVERVLPAVTAALTSGGTPGSKLLGVWQAFSQVPQLVTPELMGDMRVEYPQVWAEIDVRRTAVIASMESLFAEGVRAGEVRVGIHPRVATRILLAVAEKVLIPEVLGAGEFSPAEAIQTLMTIMAHGVFAKAPSELAPVVETRGARGPK